MLFPLFSFGIVSLLERNKNMSSPHDGILTSMAECVASLQKAVYDANGSMLSVENMKNMTLMEFLLCYGRNGVRFHAEKPPQVAASSEPFAT